MKPNGQKRGDVLNLTSLGGVNTAGPTNSDTKISHTGWSEHKYS